MKFPPKSFIRATDRRGHPYFSSTNRELDLADSLMIKWRHASRLVYLRLSTTSAIWPGWTEVALLKLEDRMLNDIRHDGYSVMVKRTDIGAAKGNPCHSPFVWMLRIRSHTPRRSEIV